jgi:hypothetical protein
MLRFFLHYGIHFLLPFAIGFLFFKKNRIQIVLIFLGAMLIDVDHFLASPILDSNRCSINFHFLHSYWAIAVYMVLAFFRKSRIFGLALLLHILADLIDCLLMF